MKITLKADYIDPHTGKKYREVRIRTREECVDDLETTFREFLQAIGYSYVTRVSIYDSKSDPALAGETEGN